MSLPWTNLGKIQVKDMGNQKCIFYKARWKPWNFYYYVCIFIQLSETFIWTVFCLFYSKFVAHFFWLSKPFLAWGPLGHLKVLWSKCLYVWCMYGVWCHKICTQAKFKNGRSYQHNFFLTESKKKVERGVKKRC